MELQVTKDTFAFKIAENPFREVVSSGGIYLGAAGSYSSDETGEMEQLNQVIKFGVVTLVGPDCKVISPGDGIFFDVRTPQPIPFNEPVWVLHEGSIRAYIKDDGTLGDLIKQKEAELRAEAFKTNLAMNAPLGATKQMAGEPGSGLKLVQ